MRLLSHNLWNGRKTPRPFNPRGVAGGCFEGFHIVQVSLSSMFLFILDPFLCFTFSQPIKIAVLLP